MNVVTGDLLAMARNGEFDVIIHGCNCMHMMGAGIAAQIARQFPDAVDVDNITEYASITKLGYFSSVVVECANDHHLKIINAYTQYNGGADLNVDALAHCFKEIAIHLRGTRVKIGYPQIGCGIAGGNWDEIAPIIDRELEGFDHTLVMYG